MRTTHIDRIPEDAHHGINLEKKCVEAGLKMTGQRRVILRVLSESEDHPSVETLYERAREQDPSISIATVYRTLNLLEQFDLVQRHEFKAESSRFEINWDHHHHLIDVDSGEVIEFISKEMEQLKERIAKELGYELLDHRLELYGRKRRS
jgi:Fur family ferric uptake transcriptional regulator